MYTHSLDGGFLSESSVHGLLMLLGINVNFLAVGSSQSSA